MTYTYDALNRLSPAKDNRIAAQGEPSAPTSYNYDPAGNLSGVRVFTNTLQTIYSVQMAVLVRLSRRGHTDGSGCPAFGVYEQSGLGLFNLRSLSSAFGGLSCGRQ
jgi:YD repeat-containing protein